MRKKVVLRRLAEQDVLEASLWYEAKSPPLRKDFLAEFEKLLIKLEKHSESFSYYYKNFRRVIVPRFPYKIFYQIENQKIIVFRVLHAKRDHRRFLT